MSMWRPLFVKCMILDHKLQRMLDDSKIAQLNSERPLHQTALGWEGGECQKEIQIGQPCLTSNKVLDHRATWS